MKYFLSAFIVLFISQVQAQTDAISTNKGEIKISPVTHGSIVLEFGQKTVYIDPYGGPEGYKDKPKPDLILITDIHGDHLDQKTLKALSIENSEFMVPQAVKEMMNEVKPKKISTLKNGEKTNWEYLTIEALPMYNLPESADSRHIKGRGNGYLITYGNKRIYISGDTEDIPEMRNLKNIDVAFVCMNEPYTMDVEQAADAVLAFKPKIIYPYHYQGAGGLSDVSKFKSMVESKNKNIEVRLRQWYP
ncbi:MBL fold metallo-hydrolase [soil metagenome]